MDFKMNITFVLISSILITSCVSGSGIDSLRAKLRSRFPGVGRSQGFGGAAAASSAAVANGGYGAPAYGSPAYGGSAAAAAAAAASGGARYAARPAYDPFPAELDEEEFVDTPPAPRFGGSAASAAAAASVATGARPAAHYRPPAPVRPVVNLDTFRRHNVAYNKPPVRYVNQYPAVGGGAASAAAAASAAGGGYGGAASSAAAAAGAAGGSGGYAGETAAATGTYANSDHGKESSSYRRSTENLLNHEDGHVDDNHYYNAQSYGKTDDENLHEAYNKDDEDVEQTPNVYRKKKSGENYVLDYNKARRESGSGVLAKDRHNSAFNKNSRKFIENVDQKHKIRGNGVVENVNHVTAHNFDDDDEEIFDSDGLDAAPVAPYGGSAAATAAAAAAAASGGSAASSASGAALH